MKEEKKKERKKETTKKEEINVDKRCQFLWQGQLSIRNIRKDVTNKLR